MRALTCVRPVRQGVALTENGNGNGSGAYWRTVGVVLGGAAAGLGANLGQSYLREEPKALGAPAGYEVRVVRLESEIEALQATFATYERAIERLSLERERRIVALESRLDYLAGRRP